MADLIRQMSKKVPLWWGVLFLAGSVVIWGVVLMLPPGPDYRTWRIDGTWWFVWTADVVAGWFLQRRLPEHTSKSVIAVLMLVVLTPFLLPLTLVALVTSGANWAIIGSIFGPIGFKNQDMIISGVRGIIMPIPVAIVVAAPEGLRRIIPWESSSDRARTQLPAWMSAWAVLFLWLSVVLMHFGDNALSRTPLGLVIVSGLGAAILIAPLCRFLARSCWEHGIVTVFDPMRWWNESLALGKEVFAPVLREWESIRREYSDADDATGEDPGSTADGAKWNIIFSEESGAESGVSSDTCSTTDSEH